MSGIPNFQHPKKRKQDACTGVHSACRREENGLNLDQRSHDLGKFPQIFAVSMGVVLGIMRVLCIPLKILLFG